MCKVQPEKKRIGVARIPLKVFKIALYTVITVHFIFLIGMVAAFPVLIWKEPWYIWMPLCSWILNIAVWPVRCPLTMLENYLRQRLDMKLIRGFISHNFKQIKVKVTLYYERSGWKGKL